jgi:signal transduction histidine kinase
MIAYKIDRFLVRHAPARRLASRFKHKNTSLSDLVVDALEVVEPLAEGKRQKINVLISHMNYPTLGPIPIWIRRVLINLIENATKYTPSRWTNI